MNPEQVSLLQTEPETPRQIVPLAAARATDPGTSWEAAHRVNKRGEKDASLLMKRLHALLYKHGPMTYDDLIVCYRAHHSEAPRADSRIRTAAKKHPKIIPAGQGTSALGGKATLWEAVL